MALTKPNVHVGPGAWSSLAFFGLFDAIKPLLFFVDVIPLVGLPVGYIFSIGVCIFQMAGGGLWLLLSGFFTFDDAIGMQNLLWYGALVVASLIPGVDDMPYTTPVILYRILATQKSDAQAMKHYEHKQKKVQERHRQDKEYKRQRATAAAQNANMNRQQAMRESIAAAANDNHSS